MRAATWVAPHRVEVQERERPRPAAGEALIRVRVAGICGSDLSIVTGKHPRARAPLVLGHELSGEVVELPIGAEGGFHVRDKVTVFPLVSCGHCRACRDGNGHVCSTLRLIGFDRDGGMADYLAVPVSMLVKLPDGMSHEVGALIEPLSVCVHASRLAGVVPADRVVVLGAGPIGLLLALLLRHLPVRALVVTDVNPYRLDLARSLGLDVVRGDQVEIVRAVEERTGGDLADVVFEAAGVQDTATAMTALARPRGTVVNVGVFKESPKVDMRAVNFRELHLLGSRVYAREDYDQAIRIAQDVAPQRIVTHRLPLGLAAEGFDLSLGGGKVCKVLFDLAEADPAG